MADKWQMSNNWKQLRSMAVARSQLDSGPSTHHQLYPVLPHELQAPAQPQSQTYQATGSSSFNTRPNDNLNTILGHFLESINFLSVQQRHFNESLAKSDRRFEELLSSVLSIRETADGLAKKLDARDEIKETRGEDKKVKEIDVMKVLVGEMKAFKKALGKSCDGDDGRTVLGRLDAITFAVGELLERARDPEANLEGPSTSTTVQPCIIDLTRSSSPPVRRTSPVPSHTYVDVGTSPDPVPSLLPLKEKPSALVRASPRCGSDSSESFSSYPGRSSTHTFANGTTTSPDTGSTALTQDNLELVPPIPMDVDTVDPTEPTIDSQTSSSTINTNNSEAVSQSQKNTALSNTSVTTTEVPHVEAIHTATAVHLSMPSGLASPKDAQNTQNIATLDAPSAHKNDKPADIHDARLLNVTPGLGPGIQTFKQPYKQPYTSASASTFTTSASSTSPTISPTPFTQTEVQRSTDKTIAALRASARLSPYLGVANPSFSGGKQQQKEQSRKQGLPERPESSLSTSTHDEETPSLDNINSEKLHMGADGDGDNEVKIKATKGVEEVKSIEKRSPKMLFRVRGDVPAPSRGLNFSQLLRRRSSSRFASPSTSSLPNRGSRPSVNPPEVISYSSSSPSDTKSSPTMAKVLAGAGVCPSTSSAASPPTASVTTRTPVTTPTKKAASVSSQSAFRPTTTNSESVAAPILPATSASILMSPAISPTKRSILAASGSSYLESASASASAVINKPLPLSQKSTLVAATPEVVISPATPAAPSRLGPVASPAAIFNELPSPSQASTNMTQDEVSVSRLVVEKENENNEGEAGNLVKKTTEKIELKMASRKFENEEEDEKQLDRLLSFPLTPLSTLSPSISGSPHFLPVEVSGPSTPLPRSALLFTQLSRQPLASASPKDQTQIDQAPESPSPPPSPFVAVVSSSCSPITINLVNDQPEPHSPLFSSPLTNNISVEQRKEKGDESVSHKLKSPDNNNGTTNPTTPPKEAASVLTHVPTQAPASIETLLPRDLSPISKVEKGKGPVRMQVEKIYKSLGDNADIVRGKKRKVLEGSSMTDRESLTNTVAKGKGKAKEQEIDVERKSGEAVKKRSLLNLILDKKGDSLAVTRVRKRKARPDSVVDGEANYMGQHDDGLDEEMPLKRARQRVSDSQMKTEPAEKGKQPSRQFSESSSGAGTSTRVMKSQPSASVKKGPPSKARISANRGQGKVEVEWPTITKEYRSEDLVGCDKCTAWYHYGCVGFSLGDKRLRDGKKFFCPPCEAGTTIKKLNMDSECWRPGCSVPAGFIVEKIIGRFKKQGLQNKYLLQWKGYKLSESSWEPEESMFDPPFMIEKFRVDALEEGIDIDKEKTELILLRVAKDSSVPKPPETHLYVRP